MLMNKMVVNFNMFGAVVEHSFMADPYGTNVIMIHWR